MDHVRSRFSLSGCSLEVTGLQAQVRLVISVVRQDKVRARVLLPIDASGWSRARPDVPNSRGSFRTLEIGDQHSNVMTHGCIWWTGCWLRCVWSPRPARSITVQSAYL
jgi:hypothetical protein